VDPTAKVEPSAPEQGRHMTSERDREILPYAVVRERLFGESAGLLPSESQVRGLNCISIDPEARIYVLGTGDKEHERFAKNVAQAWSQMPSAARAELASFWSKSNAFDDALLAQAWAPEIRLMDDWFTRGVGNSASCLGSNVFYFHRETMRRWQAMHVATQVAHEFAHPYIKAAGLQLPAPTPKPATDVKKREFLCKRWGKRPEELGKFLMTLNRNLDQMIDYTFSPEEQLVDDILREWKFEPELLR
jgi:hypothetical protein